jgi:hypothetical protein
LYYRVKMKPLDKIFEKILRAPLQDLYNDLYLLDIMCEIGILSGLHDRAGILVARPEPNDFFVSSYHNIHDKECVSPDGFMMQKRGEVLEFIKYVRNKKIQSYCEVGIGKGGLFVLMTALLMRYNKGFRLSIAVEPKDTDLDFIGNYCELDYFCTSEEVCEDEKFDLCFIDGEHTYDWVKRDWKGVGLKSRIAAFHDIKHQTLPGVMKGWKEISRDLPSFEIVHSPFDVMGIGIVINRESA